MEHNYYNCHNVTCRRMCEKDGYERAISEFEDTAIKAARKKDLSVGEIMEVFKEKGLTGVYHLGMEHMYYYLKGTAE